MSKQYELLKWYPSLPKELKEGDVLDFSFGRYRKPMGNKYVGFIPADEVENNPEFWGEVVVKDYEILSFENKTSGNIVSPNSSTKKVTHKINWDIHSVKRLSDGKVFTVGDRIEKNGLIGRVIKKIYLHQHVIRINYDSGLLSEVEHAKYFFTTEDGVDIYEGDEFYWVDEKSWAVKKPDKHNPFPRDTVNFKHFSSKINAERYVLLNKPRLSINGVISLYESLNDRSVDNFRKQLTHLAKYGKPFD